MTTAAAGAVQSSLDDEVLTISLARPAKLNAITPAMVDELAAALDAAAAPEVRVVVLRGEGRSFCAGADVHQSLGLETVDDAETFMSGLAAVLRRISSLPKPVVAAVQGHAVGGGAELALESDLRVVADDARLGFPDVALGSTPASLYQLVRMVGRSRAMDMALRGTELDASEMERLGVACAVVPADRLRDAALQVARDLRDRAGARSLRYAKEAVANAAEASRDADLATNVAAMLVCHTSVEQRAYVAGFGTRDA
jgi:enoyl-CoA hydratase/carnithine racemase